MWFSLVCDCNLVANQKFHDQKTSPGSTFISSPAVLTGIVEYVFTAEGNHWHFLISVFMTTDKIECIAVMCESEPGIRRENGVAESMEIAPWTNASLPAKSSVDGVIVRGHLLISSYFRDESIRPVLIGQKSLLNQWTSTLHSKLNES